MAEIDLGYGDSSFTLQYDPARAEILAPHEQNSPPMSDLEINAAIDRPIGSFKIDDLVGYGDKPLIVVSDATRNTGSAQIVNLLTRRLIAAGVAPGDIGIIFSTGIHRATSIEEKRRLLTPFIVQRIKTIDHNALDDSQIVNLGTTARGTPIEVNRALKDYSHVFLTGGIAFHYFAGFTGGRKSICPGLASTKTIADTHVRALDFETMGRRQGVGSGLLDGNAVHEECEQVAAAISPAFIVNTIVDAEDRVLKVFAGDWRAAHRAGCEEYGAAHRSPITERRPMVIASCGGAPYDINLIQAHKTLDMASLACAEGGTIILIAACPDGFGRPDFLKWFASSDSRALASRLKTEFEVNGQTAWSLMTRTEMFRMILVSGLDRESVEKMGMSACHSVDKAVSSAGGLTDCYIMPRGASVLPVLNESNQAKIRKVV